MVDEQGQSSPLENAAGAAGPGATEAFSVLGNDTRLSILLALWEAADPFGSEDVLSFSELRGRVGMRDSGQFNYHLDQLVGHYLEHTDEGYRLTPAGEDIIQTVIAGAAIETTHVGPTEVEAPCPQCGQAIELEYADERLHITCASCEGWAAGTAGQLADLAFPPAGLDHWSPRELVDAATIYSLHQVRSMMDGICPTCGGPIETHIEVCEDHDTDEGLCQACETRFLAAVHWACRTCKNAASAPVWMPVLTLSTVVGYCSQRGIDLDMQSWEDVMVRGSTCEQTLVSMDPLRLQITVPVDEDELQVIVDETMTVCEVQESA